MPANPVLVAIEFRRIQQFLFAVPRLRDMIGANVLLGELIRVHLPLEVSKHSPHALDATITPPEIDDPLNSALKANATHHPVPMADDPNVLYRAGILSRDGGHFRAAFTKTDGAQSFARAAAQLITSKAPGLQFDILLKRGNEDATQTSLQPTDVAGLPNFEICRETGADMAARPGPDGQPVGVRAASRREAGNRFARDGACTRDIIGLLQPELPGSHLKSPEDMDALSDHRYVALIELDGNRIGDRRRRWVDSQQGDTEVINETFFWHTRVAFRRAIVSALHQTFSAEVLRNHTVLPYQLLMLGGDDMLLVTQPRYALPLVHEIAAQLARCPVPWEGDERRAVTVAAGVAIASASYPFHALQTLAGELTASAKRIARVRASEAGEDAFEERSVVDWMATTSSMADAVEKYRRANEMRAYYVNGVLERLAYTSRPYLVLPAGDASQNSLGSLDNLLAAAEQLTRAVADPATTAAARSQLKRLAVSIRAGGRRAGELSFATLQPGLRELLVRCSGHKQVFTAVDDDNSHFLTRLIDLIELTELHRLGTKTGANA